MSSIFYILILFFFCSELSAATIVASRTTGVAPLYVSFYDSDASASDGSGVEPFHDYEYLWSFGDSESGTWGTTGKSKNSAYGPVSAHVFETAGTYTVALTSRNAGGTIGTDTETITVSAPDTVFAATATTCVNNVGDSDFTGCPSGANQVNSNTVSDLVNYAQDGERILFKYGYTATVGSLPAWPDSNGPVTIGAYGTCASRDFQGICSNAPEFTCSAGFIEMDHKQDWRVHDIRIVGSMQGGDNLYDFAQWLYLRISIEDATSTVAFGWGHFNDSTPMTIDAMALVDSKIIDSAAYGVYVGAERLGLLGNIFDDSGTTHLTRVWQSYRGVISHNRFSSANLDNANGRAAIKFTGPDDVNEDPEHCTPTNGTACLANYTAMSVISNNVFGSSGPWPVMIDPQSVAADTVISDIIFERNFLVRDFGTQNTNPNRLLHVGGMYISVRNNVFDGSNANNDYRGIVVSGTSGGTSEDYSQITITGVRIHNNTFYRSDAANDINYGVEIRAGATNTVVQNNLYSAANATSTSAPLLDNGTNTTADHNTDLDNPLFADPTNETPLSRDFTLGVGSTAINAGTTVAVLDDFAGLRRTGLTYDLGAHEYGAPTESVPVTTPTTTTGVTITGGTLH